MPAPIWNASPVLHSSLKKCACAIIFILLACSSTINILVPLRDVMVSLPAFFCAKEEVAQPAIAKPSKVVFLRYAKIFLFIFLRFFDELKKSDEITAHI